MVSCSVERLVTIRLYFTYILSNQYTIFIAGSTIPYRNSKSNYNECHKLKYNNNKRFRRINKYEQKFTFCKFLYRLWKVHEIIQNMMTDDINPNGLYLGLL